MQSISYARLEGTKPLLSLRIFLDNVFGSLTQHEFHGTPKDLNISCRDCEYLSLLKSDVCDTHLGIVAGMLKKINDKNYDVFKIINGDTCSMNVKERSE